MSVCKKTCNYKLVCWPVLMLLLLLWPRFAMGADAASFMIVHGQAAVSCLATPVTIQVLDANGQHATGYTGTVEISSSDSDSWTLDSGNGTFSDSNTSDGDARYTFSSNDNGVARFLLHHPGAGDSVTLSIRDVNDATLTTSFNSGQVDYDAAGFVVGNAALSVAGDGTHNGSFNATQTAGTPFNAYIAAYGTYVDENSNTQCGIIPDYTGSKTLLIGANKLNPTTGTKALQVDKAITGSYSDGSANTNSGASTFAVTFSSGQAQVRLRYDDVGALQLFVAEAEFSGGSLASSAKEFQSDSFVVLPADLVITSVVDAPTLSSLDHTATVFKKAGEAFTVKVEARNALGNLTPNFGKETNAEGIEVYASELVAPSGGFNGSSNDGTMVNGSAFTADSNAGAFINTTIAYDEVGIIKLKARIAGDGSYLGQGQVTSSTASSNIGRFTPYQFAVTDYATAPVLASACGTGNSAFTYLGQSIAFTTQPKITVTAQAQAGTTTQNYQGDYWKLAENIGGALTIDNSGLATGVDVSNATTTTSWIDPNDHSAQGTPALGVAMYAFSADSDFAIAKPSASGIHASPFDAEVSLVYSLTDTDSVAGTAASFAIGQTTAGNGISFSQDKEMRHGRIQVLHASGSEQLPLALPMYVEYYNGNDFVIHTQDICTQFTTTPTIANPTPNELANRVPTNAAIVSGADAGYFSSGQRKLVLSLGASETPTPGAVDVTVDVATTLPWLGYPWDHGTSNPRAQGLLGIYSGDKPIIFKREVY